MSFHPYLFFGGNCRLAFTRYGEIFGGELVLMSMADAPDGDFPPEQADLIIHAAVRIGDDLLMGSDDPMSESFGPVQGMMVTYNGPDAADVRKKFEAISEGGTVTQELIETFFSPAFGMCVDQFGTPWMFTTDPEPDGPAAG